jgi:ubiquinone/menaquinone biosynthesis C-methylase UbiE
MSELAAANDAFVNFWNDVLVPKFERFRNILLDGLSFHSKGPIEALTLRPGARVLDVGCGWGDTAIELAHKVGPGGDVLGLDCCDTFLVTARAEAARQGVANVRFVAADVQSYPFEPRWDLCFSRFGMMFFANPVAAMRNVHRALVPGGEVMFIVWRTLADNPWMSIPKQTVLRFLPPPGDDAQTCGPGPFSMASPDVVRGQMRAAGFESVEMVRNDGPVMVGTDVEQAMQFQLALGPAGEIYREAGDVATSRKQEIEDALRAAIAPYAGPHGVIMQSSSWTITARKPRA